MLQRVRSGSSLTDIPAADIDVDVELPSIVVAPEAEPGSTTPHTRVAVPSVTRPGRSKARPRTTALLALAAVALAALAAAGVVWASSDRVGAPAVAARAPDETDPAESHASESPATAAGAAPSTEAAPQEPEPAASVTLRVSSTPTGAEVTLAGEVRGHTPLELELGRAEEPLDLRVARGELEHTARIVPDRDRDVQLILARPRAVRRSPARPRRGTASRASPEAAHPPAAEPADDFARFD